MEKKKSTKSTKSAQSTATLTGATVFTDNRSPLGVLFKNKMFLFGILAVIAIATVVGGYAFYKHHKDATGTRVVCSDSLLKTASFQNSQGAVSQLTLTIGQIKALTDYSRDPNCLYSVTEYQIMSGDVTAAKSSIANLKQKYSTFIFSKSLDNGSPSISNLQKQFDVMQNATQNAKGSISPEI